MGYRCPVTTPTQADRLRSMTPAEKLHAAERLRASAFSLKEAAVRARHPDWSKEQVHAFVRDLFMFHHD